MAGKRERHTIEEFHKIAADKGGVCLSKCSPGTVINCKDKLRFRCREGHEWETVADCIVRNKGTWCKQCHYIKNRRPKKITIEHAREFAREHGGKCLSHEYHRPLELLSWECSKLHRFKMNYCNVSNGQWCPHCAGRYNLNISVMQAVARERGGQCLSEEYINNNTHLIWQCAKGHQWKARPDQIVNAGHWCPDCSKKKKLTIEQVREIGKKFDVEFIDKEYRDNKFKHRWRCKLGHEFVVSIGNMSKIKTLCPDCRKRLKKDKYS